MIVGSPGCCDGDLLPDLVPSALEPMVANTSYFAFISICYASGRTSLDPHQGWLDWSYQAPFCGAVSRSLSRTQSPVSIPRDGERGRQGKVNAILRERDCWAGYRWRAVHNRAEGCSRGGLPLTGTCDVATTRKARAPCFVPARLGGTTSAELKLELHYLPRLRRLPANRPRLEFRVFERLEYGRGKLWIAARGLHDGPSNVTFGIDQSEHDDDARLVEVVNVI